MKETIGAVIGVLLAVAITFCAIKGHVKEDSAQSTAAMEQGSAEIDRKLAEDGRRLQLHSIGLEIDIVRTEYGDATATLYEKCKLDPPKIAANQAKCKSLIDRVNQRWAKEKATEEVAAKKW
jgi:hypothetical protein